MPKIAQEGQPKTAPTPLVVIRPLNEKETKMANDSALIAQVTIIPMAKVMIRSFSTEYKEVPLSKIISTICKEQKTAMSETLTENAIGKIIKGAIKMWQSPPVEIKSSQEELIRTRFTGLTEKYFVADEKVRKTIDAELTQIIEDEAEDNPKLQKELKLEKRAVKSVVYLANMNEPGIEGSFLNSIDSLCEKNGLTTKDIKAEAKLLGISEDAAKMKMVNRLGVHRMGGIRGASPSIQKRMDETNYELSTIKAIEKTFKHYVRGEEQSKIVPIDNKITVIPTASRLIIEEKFLKAGSYKATYLS